MYTFRCVHMYICYAFKFKHTAETYTQSLSRLHDLHTIVQTIAMYANAHEYS